MPCSDGYREHRQAEVPSWLQKIIDELPIAYDIEKVVTELESAKNYYYDDKLDAEGDLIMFKSIEQEVAIKIVKGSGLNA